MIDLDHKDDRPTQAFNYDKYRKSYLIVTSLAALDVLMA